MFGPRSGPTKFQAWSLDTDFLTFSWYSQKNFFEDFNLDHKKSSKITQHAKSQGNMYAK